MTIQFHNSFIDIVSNDDYSKTITHIKSSLATVGTFEEECCKAARLIRQNNPNKNIHILFSGGQDSQIIVRSFLKEKIPVKLIYYRILTEAGKHINPGELLTAKAFAASKGVEILLEDIHITDSAVQEELRILCRDYRCERPQDAIHLLISKRLNTNNNAIVISGTYELGPWPGATGFHLLKYEQATLRDDGLIIGFFLFTPEVIVARLRNPIYDELLLHGEQYMKMHQALVGVKLSVAYIEYIFKSAIYEYEFPDLLPTAKFLGGDEGIRHNVDLMPMTYHAPQIVLDLDQLMKHFEKNDGSLLTYETMH